MLRRLLAAFLLLLTLSGSSDVFCPDSGSQDVAAAAFGDPGAQPDDPGSCDCACACACQVGFQLAVVALAADPVLLDLPSIDSAPPSTVERLFDAPHVRPPLA